MIFSTSPSHSRRRWFAGFLGGVMLGAWLVAGSVYGGGDEVVVVYNSQMPGSEAVAEHYAAARRVPSGQVFGLMLSTNEEISRAEFEQTLQMPLLTRLTNSGLWKFGTYRAPNTDEHPGRSIEGLVATRIRYLALCYGVPLKIAEAPFRFEKLPMRMAKEFQVNHAAVDSELATLPLIKLGLPIIGPLPNPFRGCTNEAILTPTNGILLVTRLDGPSAGVALQLVDKAMEAETNGLWGRGYFDARGLATNSTYYPGDDWIFSAARTAFALGYETNLDDRPDTFGPEYPLCQVALYAGWYDSDASGPFAAPTVDFMPGAIAYHLHSYSANTLRSLTRNWCGPLIGKGATCTMGCVYEPYLLLTPNIGFFLEALGNGFTFGEATWAAQGALSWQTTAIGDPLYRPFAGNLLRLHHELELRHHPQADWSTIRLLNLSLNHHAPLPNVASLLERLPETAHSAVLNEQLARLEEELGKPASAIQANRRAVDLADSALLRLRLQLELADRLEHDRQPAAAVTVLRQIVGDNPAYPGRVQIEQRCEKLTRP